MAKEPRLGPGEIPLTNYDRHRENEYYSENHPMRGKAKRRANRRRKQRIRNRERFEAIQPINWDAYNHAQLYDMIMSAKPSVMSARTQQWVELAARIDDTTSRVRDVMQRLMMTWTGGAAVQAAESNTLLTQWASEASHTSTEIAARLGRYTEAVAEAQARMPDPEFAFAERRFREGYDVKGSEGPSTAVLLEKLLDDHLVTYEQAAKAKAEAVEVMQAYETRSRDAHTDTPTYPPPPSRGETEEPPPGDGGEEPPLDDGPLDDGQGPLDGLPPDELPDGTDPSEFVPVGPGTGGAGVGVGAMPGAGGGGYGGGGGALVGGVAGGAAALRPGGAFGTGAGGSGSVAGRLAAAEAAAARGASMRGGTGMGMMPPMGAGGRDDEGEHHNKYGEETDFMDDLPPAYPPVFGA